MEPRSKRERGLGRSTATFAPGTPGGGSLEGLVRNMAFFFSAVAARSEEGLPLEALLAAHQAALIARIIIAPTPWICRSHRRLPTREMRGTAPHVLSLSQVALAPRVI